MKSRCFANSDSCKTMVNNICDSTFFTFKISSPIENCVITFRTNNTKYLNILNTKYCKF